ncbi:MAG: hypothetical protein JSU82_03850 [Rhodospirillales bacterium]|nr:MAG: hypothetical protein JSU82_03850 [Rhodospirillales bacterium]
MSKAFLYSLLLHLVVVLTAAVLPRITDFFGVQPLPVEDMVLLDVELADLTQTPERRIPETVPRPAPKPVAEPEPEPEPEPEKTEVAALPPQPKPVEEPPPPEPMPSEAAQPEVPPLPALPRAKPAPPPKEDEFESMLKDLARELEDETQQTAEAPPQQENNFLDDLAKALDETEPDPDRPLAQKATILSNRLTISEEDALSRHIEPCWNVQIGARNPEELAVDIRLYMNRDGTVRHAEVVDSGRMSRDRFYRAAAEAAMRAVLNKRCQPLPIPPHKYEQLKSFVYHFDPSKMVGR